MTFEFTSPPAPLPQRQGEGSRGKGVGWYAVAGLVSAGCAFLGVGSALGVVALAGWQLFNWTWLGGWVWWAWSGLGAMVLAGWYGWDWTRRFAEREWELEDRAYALQDVRREVIEETVVVGLAGPEMIRLAAMDLILRMMKDGKDATTREVFVAAMQGRAGWSKSNADDAWRKARVVLSVGCGVMKPAPGRGWVSEPDLAAAMLRVQDAKFEDRGAWVIVDGTFVDLRAAKDDE